MHIHKGDALGLSKEESDHLISRLNQYKTGPKVGEILAEYPEVCIPALKITDHECVPYQLYTYCIYFHLLPKLENLQKQGRLHKGMKVIQVYGKEWQYEGLLDEEGLACSYGEA